MGKNEPLYQQRIINKLAKKYDLAPDTVRRCVEHQFRFVRRIMTKGDFESIRLRYFGKFHVDPRRLKKFQERLAKSNKKDRNEERRSKNDTEEVSTGNS